MFNQKTVFLVLSLTAFFLILGLSPLEPDLTKGLALFTLIACLWLTEALHISVTALMVPLLAVLLGIFDVSESVIRFSDPILVLFLGGFILAGALHEHRVDRFLAVHLLRLSNGKVILSSWLVFAMTAFLSMWISNTATVAIMVPLVLGLLSNLEFEKSKSTYLYFLLGTAYSGSIGGMATIIGSPPNAIAAAALNLSFFEWMRYGIPMTLLALPVMIALLYLVLKPSKSIQLEALPDEEKMTGQKFRVFLVFLLTVLGWTTSSLYADILGIEKDIDSVVALLAIALLAITRSMSWEQMSRSVNWGVLILFGGGLTLSAVLSETGSSLFMAETLKTIISDLPVYLLITAAILFVIFLTELVSNTASAALLIPIFAVLAEALGLDPTAMVIVVAFAASCAFMLPVATPPNALVYATGFVKQARMMRVGFMLNLLLGFLISFLASLFLL